MYIDWSGREQEDLEGENMRADWQEEQAALQRRNIFLKFRQAVQDFFWRRRVNREWNAWLKTATEHDLEELDAFCDILR